MKFHQLLARFATGVEPSFDNSFLDINDAELANLAMTHPKISGVDYVISPRFSINVEFKDFDCHDSFYRITLRHNIQNMVDDDTSFQYNFRLFEVDKKTDEIIGHSSYVELNPIMRIAQSSASEFKVSLLELDFLKALRFSEICTAKFANGYDILPVFAEDLQYLEEVEA